MAQITHQRNALGPSEAAHQPRTRQGMQTMTNKFQPPFFLRAGNAIMTLLLRRGVKLATNTLLTVPGRKSGLPRTTPVTLIERDGRRYVQSPFGEVDWVRNLRAAGTA